MPIRAIISNTTNCTLSFHLCDTFSISGKFLISHKRFHLLPSQIPCRIKLSIPTNEIQFDPKFSCIEGPGGLKFIICLTIENEINQDVTETVSNVIIKDITSGQELKNFVKPSSSNKIEIPLQIPENESSYDWVIQVPCRIKNISRNITIKSLIGSPHIIALNNIYDESNHLLSNDLAGGETSTSNSPLDLRCGIIYKLEFNVYDKNHQKFDEDKWTQQKNYVKFWERSLYQNIGAMTKEVQIENCDTQTFPPACKIKIIASEGILEFQILANIVSLLRIVDPTNNNDVIMMNDQNSPLHNNNINLTLFNNAPVIRLEPCLIKSNVTCGRPHHISISNPPFILSAFEVCKLDAQILDIADNPVNCKDIQIFINGPTTDGSLVGNSFQFKNTGNSEFWKTFDLSFKKCGTFKITISARLSNRKKGRALTIEDYCLDISVQEATNIVTDLRVSKIPSEIVAGELLRVKANAITDQGEIVPQIEPLFQIISHDETRIYKINEPITNADEYILRTEIDKIYTKSRQNIIKEQIFFVLPNIPEKISFNPNIPNDILLQNNEWLWNDRISVQLIDGFGNSCYNLSFNKNINVFIKNIRNDEIIFRKEYSLREGKTSIGKSDFLSLSLNGSYEINFSFYENKSSKDLLKSFCFSTDISKRAAANQCEYLSNKIATLQNKYREKTKSYQQKFNQPKIHKTFDRLQEIETQLSEIEKFRNPKMEDSDNNQLNKFHEQWRIVKKLKVYQTSKTAFLGNIASLGYIGQSATLSGEVWNADRIRAFNSELTRWIGVKTLSSIVIACDDTQNQKQLEEHIITEIQHEVDRFQDTIPDLKFYQLSPKNSNSIDKLISFNEPQQPIKLPPVDAQGFLGYAVNLLYMSDKNIESKIRARLWYKILKLTMVFDTQVSLSKYCAERGAVVFAFTLDGFQRHGYSTTIQSKAHVRARANILAFEPPPSNIQKLQLVNEKQFLQHFLDDMKKEEKYIVSLEEEIQKTEQEKLKLQSQTQNSAGRSSRNSMPHSGSSVEPIVIQETQGGLQAEGFESTSRSRSSSIPSRKRVRANRGRGVAAKRGRYH